MSTQDQRSNAPIDDRKHWMSVLSKANPGELEKAWDETEPKPGYTYLRQPETGLVMVRARAGGTGRQFNFGEMTVTRCTVALADGTQGFGHVTGTDQRHAELAAVFDALMLAGDSRDQLESRVFSPLAKSYAERRQMASAKSAATKVDFFTVVRGEALR